MLKNNDDFIGGVGKDGERLIVLINPDRAIPADLRDQVHSAADRTSEVVA